MSVLSRAQLLLLGTGLILSEACTGSKSPPLQIKPLDACVVVDVQHLGEYVGQVNRISIKNHEESTLVWSADTSEGEFAQIATVTLCPGKNLIPPPIRGDASQFTYHTPGGDEFFFLEENTEYLIEVEDSRYRNPAKGIIRLGVNNH